MSYDLSKKLVIGLASSALFNLEEPDRIFREQGELIYREYQLRKEKAPLEPGVAFPFIQRLLSFNKIFPTDDPFVEVILLSRNDPNTGLRVMNSIEHYGLGITRAIFLQGRTPHKYIEPLSINLFLSANEQDVKQAITANHPAGLILKGNILDLEHTQELRIAFDFDGVLADDSAETIYKQKGLGGFIQHENEHAEKPINPGPLKPFLEKLSILQKYEFKYQEQNLGYKPNLRISIVTARNAPAHKRVINTMRSWGIETINEAFFLGGIEKNKILQILQPHIFFDDQTSHLRPTSETLASVHIPFGIANKTIANDLELSQIT